jgi:hypothetical protein
LGNNCKWLELHIIRIDGLGAIGGLLVSKLDQTTPEGLSAAKELIEKLPETEKKLLEE